MPAKKTDSTTLICASAAREAADQRARQAHQPVGDAADAHQVGGQQEERHRQQDERVVGVERLLHEHHRAEPRLDEGDRQAGQPEREGHRHAQQQQRRRRCRTGSAPPCRARAASRSCRAPAQQDAHVVENCSPRNRSQVTPVIGQARWIIHSGSSASSEMRYQAKRVNSMPPRRTPARRPARTAATRCAPRLAAPRQGSARHRPRSGCLRARRPWRRSCTIQMNRKRAISSVQM